MMIIQEERGWPGPGHARGPPPGTRGWPGPGRVARGQLRPAHVPPPEAGPAGLPVNPAVGFGDQFPLPLTAETPVSPATLASATSSRCR